MKFYYKADNHGNTQYQLHVELYDQLGVISDELKEPPRVSGAFSHIVDWFEDLTYSRHNYVGMAFAFAPLKMSEIESYLRLRRVDYFVFEFELLLMLDKVFLSIMNKETKDE